VIRGTPEETSGIPHMAATIIDAVKMPHSGIHPTTYEMVDERD
jgi:hypothetical protein